MNLHIGMITEAEDTFTESIMTEENAEIFRIDTIKAVVNENEFYSCSIDNSNGESMSFTVDNFISPMDITLLHFLCHAYQEYFAEGCIVDEEQIHLELASNEQIYTHTRHISISLLQKIIFSAIARKDKTCLYSNFSPDKRIKIFYENEVYPLLSQEYLDGEFDGD
jgi:hypothetical protein